MNIPERHADSGADNWNNQILRSLVFPVPAEDAVVAAAAACLVTSDAPSAVAIAFVDSSQCIVARASRDSAGHIEVFPETRSESVAVLLDERLLSAAFSSLDESDVSCSMTWPQYLAACVFQSQNDSDNPLTGPVVKQILARTVGPQRNIPAADQLESLAEFAAGAGHEINNPLGSIVGQIQLLLKSEQQTERRRSLSTIGAQAWRIRDMIGDCMLFARPPAPELRNCPMNNVVRSAVQNAAQALGEPLSKLQLVLADVELTAMIDMTQFPTLISHLVRNALEFSRDMDVDEPVTVALSHHLGVLMLTVEDRGPTLDNEVTRRHIFDPYFSGRQAGRGLGFGLPVCWQIARNHGGLLLHEPAVDGGNRFLVAIPRGTS